MAREVFLLPDLGEGLTEAEILHWLVAEGDTVTLNQPIVEVETAKAAVEIPSPHAGVIATLHAAEGETLDVGKPLISFDTESRGGGATVENPPIQGGDLVPDAPKDIPEEKIEVLVGSGPKAGHTSRRARRKTAPAAAVAANASS